MLLAQNIHKSYGNVQVLRGISIRVEEGQMATLLGSSGAGKTTLLQIIGLLETPNDGEVYFDGRLINTLTDNQKAKFRSESLGYVFQFHHLLPEFTALENVCIPAFIRGESGAKVTARATELLTRLHLDHRLTHKPSELSGGEQQRVAVARALMNKPKMILADEPTGNLDTQNSLELFDLFRRLAVEERVIFLVATHNEDFAASSDICYRIQDGRLSNTSTLNASPQKA
jgi:lipoprotein-releasing system ATP-binding protein